MSDSPHPSGPHPSGSRLRECAAFHHIPFKSVPVKARHDGWTPERQRGFIDRLCLTGNVARSARAVGKSPRSAYSLREHAGAGSFARAWDQALASGQSYQIDVGLERSILGQRVPIVRGGVCVAEQHRFDNGLTIATLNAMAHRRRARAAPSEAGLKSNDNFGPSAGTS